LTSDEIARIEDQVSHLKAAAQGGDYKMIRRGIEGLDKATRRFAELMMDSTLAGAMTGKTMTSAGESIGEGPTAPHPFAKAEMLSADVEAEKIEESVKDEATAGESTED
jgi:molecular chaperone DnaK/molecular chaperone HscA